MIQISKKRFILILIGIFMIGALLMGSVCAFVMSSPGAASGGDGKLSEIQSYIDQYYLEDYDSDQLVEGAYKGYVEGLGDPYSAYMTKDEYESWEATATGNYSGVGITFTEDDQGNYTVLSVAKNSPAEKAGVEEGDYILSVDGETYDDSEVMAAHIRGKKGTEVTLSIYHDEDIRDVKMERDDIVTESISYKMLDGDIGYIEISEFVENTAEDFQKALNTLEKQGAKGLVLDLRNNGGGLVDQCVAVADEFLDEGVVCYVEDKNGDTSTYDAEDGKTDLETVVLINEGSASASEILAGALKDNGFEVVGTKSFGKGVIQTTLDMDDGSALKLTIMRYLSPDKHVIHEKGIKPTVSVQDDEDTKADEQLEKAEELLK